MERLIRPDEPLKLYSNNRKARKFLNWMPKVSLNDGLNRTIKNYEKILDIIIVNCHNGGKYLSGV